ncbi:MAG: DUF2085 domain-containing protein [Chloroflexi bacterium]|nr:DUF2085 domain-containing protein [Chloroflexota bacterium]
MTTETVDRSKQTARRANRFMYKLATRWLTVVNTFMGVLVGLPWLAPIFMRLGWEWPAKVIYTIYMGLCHQMPQRSYFIFGRQPMYSLEEVALVWQNVANPLILRQFVGTADMGWKVAWSDRMVSMYGAIFLFGLVYGWVRPWLKRPLPLWGFILFCVPMGIDGLTHMISDLYGLEAGFRYHNTWLADLTNNAFQPLFYYGDAFGSFNWWMRLVTGLLFGLGLVWFAFPHLQEGFNQTKYEIEAKFAKAGVPLAE